MCPVRPSEGVCTRRAPPSPHHRSHIKHYELLSGQRRANQPALAAGRAREAHMQAGGVAHQGESVDYARSGRRSGRCVHQSGLSRGPERQRAGRRRAGAGELWGGERAPKWPLGSLYRRAKAKINQSRRRCRPPHVIPGSTVKLTCTVGRMHIGRRGVRKFGLDVDILLF